MKKDLGLLFLRIGFGGMMLGAHGLPKLMNFNEASSTFPDPIGLGSSISLGLAIFAEFLASLAIILGVKTRLAAIPFGVTMAIAAFVVHAADPFAKMEKALLYLIAAIVIFLTGPGRYSVDGSYNQE
jgi:putative oxidoreductase